MLVIIALLFGVGLALFVPVNIPAELTPYVAIAILAGMDSVFGGFAATINNNFKMKIFMTGLFGNAILAMVLTYIGKLLDVDIYLAAVIVFGTRLFQNFSVIRRFLLSRRSSD
ncbi:MAG: small basic family protein [Eubacteriales bacterium]|nr:small basic family protein [Eubacteriales bacterium]